MRIKPRSQGLQHTIGSLQPSFFVETTIRLCLLGIFLGFFCSIRFVPCAGLARLASQEEPSSPPEGGFSQADAELEDYLQRIDTAQQLRNYNLALKLLLEAQQKFPTTALLWLLSGELYEQQTLLRLSLESYLQAQELEPQNTRFIRRSASVQDRLGKYAEAIASYRKLEKLGNPIEQNEARRKNGWLLYKLHHYQEAEASILAIPEEDRNSSIMMTLAIIYSAAYDYEKSRQAYEQSIALTYPRQSGKKQIYSLQNRINQRALSYYNYALLEADFMNFDRAMELNQKSIASISFPSNELFQGELHLQQRQFRKAKDAFLKSQHLEEQSSKPSPLALLDLVQLSLDRGQFTEGMIYFRELELRFRKQTAWMTSYGIDPVNFDLELMKLRSSLYRGLLQEQKWFLPLSLLESLHRYRKLLQYRILYWYADTREKLLAYQVGKDHYLQGNTLDASQKLFDASDVRSQIHKHFFQQLRDENLALIPRSKGVLLLQEAMIQHSIPKLEQSLKLLDTKWQAEDREEAHLELSKLLSAAPLRYRHTLQAYHSNRAALKNAGIPLPLRLQISGSAARNQRRTANLLSSYLAKAGAEVVRSPSQAVPRLQIQWSDTTIKAYFLSEKGTVLDSIDSRPLQAIIEENLGMGQRRKVLKRFARSFMQQAFYPQN